MFEQDEPHNIYTFIESIRPRPGLYIGTPSIKRLEVYLLGYFAALKFHEIDEQEVPPFTYFLEWLMITQKGSWKYGWAEGLLRRSKNDNEVALEKFFQFVQQYKSLQPTITELLSLTPEQKYSEEFSRCNGNKHPVPTCLQLVYLRPGKLCYLKYWFGDKSRRKDLYKDVSTALKAVEWEFSISPTEWANRAKIQRLSTE